MEGEDMTYKNLMKHAELGNPIYIKDERVWGILKNSPKNDGLGMIWFRILNGSGWGGLTYSYLHFLRPASKLERERINKKLNTVTNTFR